MADILIKNAIIYTMNTQRRIIKDGAIAIEGNSIIDLGENDQVSKTHEAEFIVDGKGKAVLPGFVNVHTHLPSIFVRGVYGVVRQGLYQVLFPVKKYLKPEDCYTFGLASCIEAITSGSTTIQETYNYMDQFAEAASVTGIRADLGEQIAEADYQKIKNGVYSYIPEQAEEMIERAVKLKKWDGKADGRITVSWAPLAPDMITPWVYEKVLEHQKEGEKISTHISQSLREVNQVKSLYNKTSVELLTDIGIMGKDLIGAHCTHCTPSDLKTLKEQNASILHCPRPYILGGATMPLSKWLQEGIKVGLGTDNVCHNMWETMRAGLYASRVLEAGTGVASPSFYEFLELATRKGAEVLGRDDIGSLEIGKKADLILIDILQPNIYPTVDITSSLVLYGSTSNVDTVIIDGKILKMDGALSIVDEQKCLLDAQRLSNKIWDNLFKDRPEVKSLVEKQVNK